MPMNPAVSICILVRDHISGLEDSLQSCQALADEVIVIRVGPNASLKQPLQPDTIQVYSLSEDNFSQNVRELLRAQAHGEWLLWLNAGETLNPATADQLSHLMQRETDGFFLPLLPSDPYRSGDPGLEIKNVSLRLLRRNIDLPAEESGLKSGKNLAGSDVEIFQPKSSEAESSLILFESGVCREPDPAWAQYQAGIRAYHNADFETAARCFSEARRCLSPATIFHPLLTYNLILTKLAQENWEAAREEIKTALSQFPDAVNFYYLDGYCFFQQYDFTRAQKSWEHCLSLEELALKQPKALPSKEHDSLFHSALYRLGQVSYLQGKPEQTSKYWLHAFALCPDWLTPLNAWLRLQRKLGKKPEELIGFLQKIMPDLKPADSIIRLQLLKGMVEPATLLAMLETGAEGWLGCIDSYLHYILLKAECLLKLRRFRSLDAFLAAEMKTLLNESEWQAHPDAQWRLTKLLICHCFSRWCHSPSRQADDVIGKMPFAQPERRDLLRLDLYMTSFHNSTGKTRLTREAVAIMDEFAQTAIAAGLSGCIVKIYSFFGETAGTDKADDGKTAWSIGKALFRAEDYDGAYRYLQQALENCAGDAEGLKYLGGIYKRKRLFAEAQSCFEASLKLQPARQAYLELTCAYLEELIFYTTGGLTLLPGAEDLQMEQKEARQCLSFLQRLLVIHD
jgi:tetratricopeptide (TPR) repeat protein